MFFNILGIILSIVVVPFAFSSNVLVHKWFVDEGFGSNAGYGSAVYSMCTALMVGASLLLAGLDLRTAIVIALVVMGLSVIVAFSAKGRDFIARLTGRFGAILKGLRSSRE